jgi:PAS domain S-box-containing protein
MRLALDNLADGVTIHDATGKLLYANEAVARMMGMEIDEILAAPAGAWQERFQMYDEQGKELPLDRLPGRRVFRGEYPEPLLLRSVDRETGVGQWVRIKATPMLDEDGNIAAAVNVTEEVTEVKEAELAQRLLAEAGQTLAASLDYEKTLQEVAQLAVPGFADWAGVDLATPDGDVEQVAIAHADPGMVELAVRSRERYPPVLEEDRGLGRVLRTGETEYWPDIPDELLVETAQDEEHLQLLRSVGLRSALIAPLRFGDRVIGAISFVLADRTFSHGDIRLAEQLADRAVIAIENSRLFTERARIARTLQEGLLPPSLEAPPGWETAVLFRAAGSANEVGGDFYDTIQLGDAWLSFVGDVAGKGARAAALTARARYTMISVAQLTGSPEKAVERVNDAFLTMEGSPLCTLAAVRLPGMDPGGRIEVLSAGHPLPYLVTNDGGVTPLGTTGPLLGFVAHPGWPYMTADVEPGECVVLFSDGVLDTMSDDRRHFGEHRLMDVLGASPVVDAAELIERIDRALLEFQGAEQRDDVAVLALRRLP